MEKYEALWAYQTEDMKADAIANAIKRSPTRQKLEKARDFILDRQKQYKQIEDEVIAMADRKDVISQAVERSEAQLESLKKQFVVWMQCRMILAKQSRWSTRALHQCSFVRSMNSE